MSSWLGRRRSRAATSRGRRVRRGGPRLGCCAGPRGAFEQLEGRELLAIGSGATPAIVQSQYAQLPLSFEANQGKTNSQVDYLARGAGYTLYLTDSGATFDFRESVKTSSAPGGAAREISGTVVRMQFVGANPGGAVTGLDRQQAVSNYLVGSEPSQWRTGVANYGQVEYQNLYAGISAVFHGSQGQLEYDFNVAPGADPNQIQLQIDGASGLSLDGAGDLLIHTARGDLVQKAPTLYQEVNGQRVAVSGHFVLAGADRVGFAVGGYDASRPLVIDPTLNYSTYLGGISHDAAGGIAVDGVGSAYVTGFTTSANFPTTAGAYRTVTNGAQDVFVTKLNAAGTGLVYSTYLGGSGDDEGAAIAVDGFGSAYVTGFTSSTNFPFTGGVVQPTLGGFTDAFVVKLSADGRSLVYSTYLGGNGNDAGRGIAVDGFESAYVTGETSSTNFPTTPGAVDTVLTSFESDAFVTKLNANGRAFAYSTLLGGGGQDVGAAIAVDVFGIAFVTGSTTSTNFLTTPGAYQTTLGGGQDAFVTRVNPDGRSLLYSTYLGGSANDGGAGVAVDGADSAYVTGFTNSTNFPVTPGAFQTVVGRGSDAFVTKLRFDGQRLLYSTGLGGGGNESGAAIAVDGAGNAFVTGVTSSPAFPTTSDAFQTTARGPSDAFVSKLNSSGGGLLYSTRLGGTADDSGAGVAVDGAGGIYVAGNTTSLNFPVTPGAVQPTLQGGQAAFVSKFQNVPPTTPIDIDPAPSIVVEGAPRGTYVGLTAFSVNPAGGSVTYRLIGDSSGGGFQIDPVSGRVTVANGAKISFAAANHAYQVVVQAVAADGASSAQIFTIAVTFDAAHNRRFIAQLYSDLLSRPVDAGGLAFWTGQLAAGVTRSQVALAIEGTLEYDVRIVAGLYQRYLHRAADPNGLAFFAQRLSQGLSIEAIAAQLAGSNEFFVQQGGGTNAGFLNALYQDALGRPIDSAGLAWWNSQLAAGLSRTQAAAQILATGEYFAGVVQATYHQLLGRGADAAGLAHWVGVLRAGLSDQQLTASIAGSGEYYARTA